MTASDDDVVVAAVVAVMVQSHLQGNPVSRPAVELPNTTRKVPKSQIWTSSNLWIHLPPLRRLHPLRPVRNEIHKVGLAADDVAEDAVVVEENVARINVNVDQHHVKRPLRLRPEMTTSTVT